MLFFFNALALPAQDRRGNMPMETDSNVVNRTVDPVKVADSEQTTRFYDSLRTKTHRGWFSRIIYDAIFRNPPKEPINEGKFVDESERYRPFEGKIIGEINIERKQIYAKGVRGLRRYANAVHMLTRESAIRKELLFRSGDKIDPQQIVANKQLLRSRDYLADISFEFKYRGGDSLVMDVYIRTHDKWTISVDGEWLNGGRTMVELYDANFLGTGDRFSVKSYFDRSNFGYEGNMFEYDVSNLLGTFYKTNIAFGQSFEDKMFSTSIRKDFIRPTDYDVGVSYSDYTEKYYQLYVDTTTMIKGREFSGWLGKSFYINPMKSSIYATAIYSQADFRLRPTDAAEFGPGINPAFHNHKRALFGLGLYREKFYTTNMIYGYGYKEYLAAGYQAEFVTGYSWGEFRNDLYLGMNLKKGGFSTLGYFMGTIELGSFVDSNRGNWWQSGVDINVRWISNLWTRGLNRLRQFVTIDYTHGWNRGIGNDEVITFTKINGPKTINEWMAGTNRAVLNTETVVFTPLQPLGFRMALFGFVDMGLLGFNANPFENKFFTTLGFGVRLKNERLVFKTIQIRLGIALGKGGLIQNQYLRLSSEQRMNQYQLRPSAPEVVRYK